MNEIKPLTSIRGLFALYVAIYHIFPRTNLFLENGYLSVDLFFVLSGFIMSYVYSTKFSCTLKTKDYLSYLRGRIARTYPLYAFLIILISFIYILNGIELPNTSDYVILFSFLQSIFYVNNNLIPHAWSIAVEFIAYMLFPFAILLIYKVRNVIFIASAITLGFTGLYLASFKGYWGPLDIVSGKFAIIRCLSDYALGLVSFLIYVKAKSLLSKNKLEIALISSLALALLLLSFRGYDVIIVACFATLIPLLAASQGIIYRFMSLSPMVYLGEISYSIYLIHYPLCRKLSFIPAWIQSKTVLFDINHVVLILTIIFSVLTYHFIEIPCRNFIRGQLIKSSTNVA